MGRRNRKIERFAALASALALLCTATLAATPDTAVSAKAPHKGKKRKKRKAAPQSRPNIVVVMTDDQRADDVRVMPQLLGRVAGRGVNFANNFVSYSFCCPSRTTYFTGQYAHNHGVLTNVPPAGGYPKFAPTIGNSLPAWLQRSGYYTGLIGELVNSYNTLAVPPGWSEFYGSYGAGAYGYSLNENGHLVHYGSTPDVVDPATYQTDVQSAKAVDFIRRRAPSSQPFYLNVATFAPHAEDPGTCNCATDNPRAAPRHEGVFANEPLPQPASYNEADVSDKPAVTQAFNPLNPTAQNAIRQLYRDRLESLLAVDDLVGRVLDTLKQQGELENTMVIFTSDNGWLLGEHRWPSGKILPYEPSIRVPLMMRGPGVPSGATRTQPVANVDLASTLLDLADATPGRAQDGRSLLPLLTHPSLEWGRGILLEAYYNAFDEFPGSPRIVYDGVRTARYMYARYENGDEELYDLRQDPDELQSAHTNPAYAPVKAALQRLMGRLKGCAGANCLITPELKLRLGGGARCGGAGTARLAGSDLSQVTLARFAVGKKSVTDARAPFAVKLRKGVRPSANVTTLDGRELTLKAPKARSCGAKK